MFLSISGAGLTLSSKSTVITAVFLIIPGAGLTWSDKSTIITGLTRSYKSTIHSRCRFDVVRFMKDLNLKLAGLSGFKADTDPWSRKQSYEKLGTNKAVACLGVAGYSDPCPDRTGVAGVASLPSLGFTTFAFSLLSVPLSSF